MGIVGTSVKSKKNLGAMRISHDQERIGFGQKKDSGGAMKEE